MQETVYLLRFQHQDPIEQTKNRLKKLFRFAGFDTIIGKYDITAVKVHFGEPGNTTYIPSHYVEPIVRMIHSCGAKAFVTDTNVLYKSRRDNAIDHLVVAAEHGFTLEKLGAPVIIADGILGRNAIEIEIDAPLNKKIPLATELVSANSAVVVTHATGHMGTGLAATIKNLGMGMSSRRGKLTQHSVSKPVISETKCTACGVCAEWCPVDAITVGNKYAVINETVCIGCGECLAVCRFNAVKFKWDSSSELLQKQIAEHALGIVNQKKGKIAYFTFLITMTKDCDCGAQKPIAIIADIGVLAGTDPVAIDQAVYDLTREKAGKSLSQMAYPEHDATIQMAYGEQIGLGSRKYRLVETDF
ncbi:MAG: DUF362 domain-containing protein [Fidelibacterota bacterium]